jgi:sugar O-acyltransferase (sialic acid O-acetyltransferase NeuD family)
MKRLIIVGCGQVADIVAKTLDLMGGYEIVCYADDDQSKVNGVYNGKPVVSFNKISISYPPSMHDMFIAIGYKDLNKLRENKYIEAKKLGYRLINVIHPNVGLLNAKIGDNCYIQDGQSIQDFTQIGNNCFIFSGVLLAHHSRIEDHCWIAAGVKVAGNSVIGARCFMGVGAIVGHMIKIGENSIIGAGALIVKNTTENSVFIAPSTPRYRLDSSEFLKMGWLS